MSDNQEKSHKNSSLLEVIKKLNNQDDPVRSYELLDETEFLESNNLNVYMTDKTASIVAKFYEHNKDGLFIKFSEMKSDKHKDTYAVCYFTFYYDNFIIKPSIVYVIFTKTDKIKVYNNDVIKIDSDLSLNDVLKHNIDIFFELRKRWSYEIIVNSLI